MKYLSILIFSALLSVTSCTSKKDATSELPQGSFIYELYFAEFGDKTKNVECSVSIEGTKITVEQTDKTNFPGGKIIQKGILMKHKSGKWIIGEKSEDKDADEIGGCTDGPTPIDFETKEIEWC